MQPPTPRSYALAIPTGDYPRKDTSASLHGYPHCPRWDATHPSPHEGVQEQTPLLDNGARSARCAHSI
jgi:hypothetical protein